MKFVEYAKILKFPDNPEEVKDLLATEQYLLDALSREEVYSDRVETRKQLKSVREAIRGHITEKYKNDIGQNVTILW